MRPNFDRLLYAALGICLLASMARPAFAENNDRVSFGQRIVVTDNDTAGDLVCFLCSVEVHGTVEGNVVSFLGGVKSDGKVNGDLVSFLGDVSLSGNSTVDGQVVLMGGALHKGADVRLGENEVVFPPAVFVFPFVLIAAIFWGITRIFRRRPMYYRPLR